MRIMRSRIIQERVWVDNTRDILKLNHILRNILHLSCVSPLYPHVSPPFERDVIGFLTREYIMQTTLHINAIAELIVR